MIKATVIIPTFKRPGLAQQLAKQIRQWHGPEEIEIIIVDQENSGETSLDKKLAVGNFNLPRANTSAAKNKGVSEAKGDILIFFDDDVELTNQTISKHLEAYKNNDVVGVSGRVITDREAIPTETEVKTGMTNFLATKFDLRFWSTKKQYVDFAYGCNMSFRKAVFLKIGGFDEGFSKIFEEIDLGVRISKEVGRIIFLPETLVYHNRAKSGGTRSSPNEKQKMIFAHYGYYLAKRVPFPFSIIPLILRTKTAFFEAPYALPMLYAGYLNYYWRFMRLFFSKRNNALLFTVFAGLVFLRLYKAPEFFSFNFDEEYQAHLAWQQVKHFHRIWIGVSASNLQYYLGPGFTYLNAFLFKLSHGDPLILAYFSPLLGIVTMLSVIYITRKLFSEKAAVIAGLLYGGSAFLNYFDRRFWNPSFMPFISVWMVYSLVQAKKNPRWLIVTIALFASSLHVHLGLMIFIPLIILVIFSERKRINLMTASVMIATYLFITFPLLVFDFVHNFDNLKAPFRFFTDKTNGVSNFSVYKIIGHVQAFVTMLGRVWFLKFGTNIQNEHGLGQHGNMAGGNILYLFSLGAIFYSARASFLLFSSLFLFSVTFFLYPGYAAEYYMLGFFALLAIAGGFLLAKLPSKILIFSLGTYIVLNALTIFTTTQEQYGLLTRKMLIRETMKKIGNKPFSVETYGKDPRKYHPYGGWRYLFKAYGVTPVQSFADEHFDWIYPDEKNNIPPKYKVVISEEKALSFIDKPVYEFKNGAFYVYIINIK